MNRASSRSPARNSSRHQPSARPAGGRRRTACRSHTSSPRDDGAVDDGYLTAEVRQVVVLETHVLVDQGDRSTSRGARRWQAQLAQELDVKWVEVKVGASPPPSGRPAPGGRGAARPSLRSRSWHVQPPPRRPVRRTGPGGPASESPDPSRAATPRRACGRGSHIHVRHRTGRACHVLSGIGNRRDGGVSALEASHGALRAAAAAIGRAASWPCTRCPSLFSAPSVGRQPPTIESPSSLRSCQTHVSAGPSSGALGSPCPTSSEERRDAAGRIVGDGRSAR